MRDYWLRFGCFLTGYNFRILKGCSENAAKRVLRYTSAMIIPCFLWAFVGYFFCNRYLQLNWYFATFGAVTMVIFVIQIERQVILSSTTRRAPLYFRGLIAVAMGIISSLIMDQLLFKEDIEKEKIIMMEKEIDLVFPSKAAELRNQILAIDSAIYFKEIERKAMVDDISKNPTIPVFTKQVTQQNIDTTSTETIVKTSSQIQNPRIALMDPLDKQIAGLRADKMKKDSMLLVLRPIVEEQLKSKVGFLDEIKLMFSILTKSKIAMGVWILLFVFLFGIEAFILISKWRETETDYDAVVRQQEILHHKRLELLSRQ